MESQVHVYYSDGGTEGKGRYPYIWLQDNCQCNESFNPVLHSRQSHISSLDPMMKPVDVKILDDNSSMEIKWENNHVSKFNARFLHERVFPDDRQEADDSLFFNMFHELGAVNTWGAEMISEIKYHDYNELMNDDIVLKSWIESLWRKGLTIIENVPPVGKDCWWENAPLRSVSKRISFNRSTNYGQFFEVFNKPNAQNVAYTNGRLNLHTDLPAYKNCPEIQLLHCIKQATTGGSNFMVDAFKVAQYVREEHPEIFDILVNVPIHFREYGHDDHVGYFDLTSKHNIIQLDPVTKKIEKVCWSQHQRASKMDVPLGRVKEVYSAMMKWDALLNDERFMIKILLKEGDIMCFSNTRVLHGREEYTVSGDDTRWLQGCYMEWDEVRSRFRSLRDVHGREWDDVL